MAEDPGIDVSAEIGMLYESEVLALQQLKRWMDRKLLGKQVSIQGFLDEITDRLAKQGFNSVVRLITDEEYDGPEEQRMWYPSILLISRVEPEEEFDHDRMKHEVRSDIRGLNQQGDVQAKSVGQSGFETRRSGLVVPKGK